MNCTAGELHCKKASKKYGPKKYDHFRKPSNLKHRHQKQIEKGIKRKQRKEQKKLKKKKNDSHFVSPEREEKIVVMKQDQDAIKEQAGTLKNVMANVNYLIEGGAENATLFH